MTEPRIPTQLQLHQRDRQLLERIKPLIGDTSMSAAASFVFDHAGEQIVAWLEEGVQLKRLGTNEPPINHQLGTNEPPINHQLGTNEPPINHQLGTNEPPINHQLGTHDAISDLDALLGN